MKSKVPKFISVPLDDFNVAVMALKIALDVNLHFSLSDEVPEDYRKDFHEQSLKFWSAYQSFLECKRFYYKSQCQE